MLHINSIDLSSRISYVYVTVDCPKEMLTRSLSIQTDILGVFSRENKYLIAKLNEIPVTKPSVYNLISIRKQLNRFFERKLTEEQIAYKRAKKLNKRHQKHLVLRLLLESDKLKDGAFGITDYSIEILESLVNTTRDLACIFVNEFNLKAVENEAVKEEKKPSLLSLQMSMKNMLIKYNRCLREFYPAESIPTRARRRRETFQKHRISASPKKISFESTKPRLESQEEVNEEEPGTSGLGSSFSQPTISESSNKPSLETMGKRLLSQEKNEEEYETFKPQKEYRI